MKLCSAAARFRVTNSVIEKAVSFKEVVSMLGNGSPSISETTDGQDNQTNSVRKRIVGIICLIEDCGDLSHRISLRSTAWGGTDVISYLLSLYAHPTNYKLPLGFNKS